MEQVKPVETDAAIAARARQHLEDVVRIDSSSDETSATIPSSPGQERLSAWLGEFFSGLGARVERDPHQNLIASLDGRGIGAGKPPLALLVHIDTARGTRAVDRLELTPAWDGRPIPFPARPDLEVSPANYPDLARFLGHQVLHGPGDAPFGLDDKLGLSHLMTLAWLLRNNPAIPHPPLLLIGRPDEEIGRMAAVEGLAALLAARGVRSGYTVDGIEPFEVNVANFNGAKASVWFAPRPLADPGWPAVHLRIGGVNTHGATAKAEGHRPATRLAAEILARLADRGLVPGSIVFGSFVSDALRDCDADLVVRVRDAAARAALAEAVEAVVGPHRTRGASWRIGDTAATTPPDGAVADLLGFVAGFLASRPGWPLAAEDSSGWEGYSQPYRALPDARGLRLDVRLRDFDPAALAARGQHVRTLAGARPVEVENQYVNMGPKLKERPELVAWAEAAGAAAGVTTTMLPIRGGTGVDPFLDRDVAIANLGTGYFAPESEKELTTLELMTGHVRWLTALVQVIAAA